MWLLCLKTNCLVPFRKYNYIWGLEGLSANPLHWKRIKYITTGSKLFRAQWISCSSYGISFASQMHGDLCVMTVSMNQKLNFGATWCHTLAINTSVIQSINMLVLTCVLFFPLKMPKSMGKKSRFFNLWHFWPIFLQVVILCVIHWWVKEYSKKFLPLDSLERHYAWIMCLHIQQLPRRRCTEFLHCTRNLNS